MYNDVLNLAYIHAGYEYMKVLRYFWGTENSTVYTEYEEDRLRAFLCFIPLPLEYDMICVTDRYNEYTLATWKQVSKTLKERKKEIRINSITRHPAIQKVILKYNGYRDGDTLIFKKD